MDFWKSFGFFSDVSWQVPMAWQTSPFCCEHLWSEPFHRIILASEPEGSWVDNCVAWKVPWMSWWHWNSVAEGYPHKVDVQNRTMSYKSLVQQEGGSWSNMIERWRNFVQRQISSNDITASDDTGGNIPYPGHVQTRTILRFSMFSSTNDYQFDAVARRGYSMPYHLAKACHMICPP